MKVVCVDDESLALEFIEQQLEKIDEITVRATFINPLDGMDYIVNHDVDIVFLDIQMPHINGIQVAEKILEKKPYLPIVFVTAYNEFAVEAFQLNALDYIVKPISVDRLKVTLSRVKEKIAHEKKETLLLKVNYLQIQLAPFLAFGEGDELKPIQWRTRKAEELFLYLLLNHNTLVEKSSLIELLWSEYEMEKAYALLYTTIYNVRKQLKQYHQHIVLHNRADGYVLELKNVNVDLETWEQELIKLPPVNAATIEDYEHVMQLNKGVYLDSHDYFWAESERHRLDSIWLRTASQLAHFYKETEQSLAAIRWYNAIIDRQPTTEEAHFSLMKLYEENGDFTLMMKQYSELNKILRDNLEGKPSEEVVNWYISKMK